MQQLKIKARRPVSALRRDRVTDASTHKHDQRQRAERAHYVPRIKHTLGNGDGLSAKHQHMLEAGDFPEKQALPRGEA